MKRIHIMLTLICFIGTMGLSAQELSIIPKPQSISYQSGIYKLPTFPNVSADNQFKEIAKLLQEHPFFSFRDVKSIKIKKQNSLKGIRLQKANLANNAYQMRVDEQGVLLEANTNEAMINAVMTLIQIAYIQKEGNSIPYLTLKDAPRFGYRGLHLDVSRHFFPMTFLEKYIDLMAIYKFNTFHWHLTDGAGWRLEIKKYPLLTEKAAWRPYSTWKEWWKGTRHYVAMGNANASGGYYTQEDAKHLIEYAARKGITIIPEIEVPGHSEEVLAVYPELSCSGLPYKNSEFCIGNEETFTFLTEVLSEVIDIFPSKYIHIGGDEADKTAWKTCPKCQKRMQDEGLSSEDELQSYAIKRMETYLNSKGRKLIGWDEILEGGLAPDATVMSWRGEEGGIIAANSGHDVIMTPGAPMYFDSYQTNPIGQPEAIGGFSPINKVYAYDPVAKGIKEENKKHVLGVQANLWTEYVPTTEHAEYMVYPRAIALSEVAWTPVENKEWTDFHKRLQDHYLLLQRLNVNYYRPSFNSLVSAQFNLATKTATVSISSEQYQPNIQYTIDGTLPTANSPRYTEPFSLTNSALVQSAIFQDTLRLGLVDSLQIDIHKAIGKKVVYNSPWDSYKAQGESTLVNGVKGGLSYGDGEWQGFTRGGLDIVIDLEQQEKLRLVSIRFMQVTGPGVYMPGKVTLETSDNNVDFTEIAYLDNDISIDHNTLIFKNFDFNLQSVKTRFIRLKATNPQRGFLFTDEVVVY